MAKAPAKHHRTTAPAGPLSSLSPAVQDLLCVAFLYVVTLVLFRGIIFDNAAFHKKKDLEAIATEHGHHILFLPPYSPDFSPIENDFANLKKRRQYAPPNTSIASIIKSYGNYCP